MKTKFSHEELEQLGFKEYRNLLYKELARLKKEGTDGKNQVDFLILGQFKFKDTGAKTIPLVIVGDRDAKWNNYLKTTLVQRPEKDLAFGSCGFSAKEGEFDIILKKGRVPSTVLNLLNKLIFEPAKLTAVLSEKGGEAEENEKEDIASEDSAAGVAAAAAASAGKAAKEKPSKEDAKAAKIEKMKAAAEKELTAISKLLAVFKDKWTALQQTVVAKMKAGEAITKKDMASIKVVSGICDQFDAQYKKSTKLTQKEVAKGHADIAQARKDLQKFAVLAQQKKVSLAQTLADKFFMNKAKRAAKAEEVEQMQKALQTAISVSGVNKLKPENKEKMLRNIYVTATLLGPKFKYEQVQLVAAKIKAA